MIKFVFLFFMGIAGIACRSVPPPPFANDCRLFPVSFEDSEFFNDSSMEASFKGYYNETKTGVFYKIQFDGDEHPEKVLVLEKESDKLRLVDLLDSKQIPISKEKEQAFESFLLNVEKGNYMQLCSGARSEAPTSILLVKSDGLIVFKYESRQYDYTQLNNDERQKIKNALALLDLLVGNTK